MNFKIIKKNDIVFISYSFLFLNILKIHIAFSVFQRYELILSYNSLFFFIFLHIDIISRQKFLSLFYFTVHMIDIYKHFK